jgi:hypothetical protein
MEFPDPVNIALKEWDTLCRALGAGRQILLLRKGGIYESAGGFEIENRTFLLFPTFLHQNPTMLKDDALKWYEKRAAEPDQITLAFAGAISDIVRVQSRAQIDALDAEHIWTSPLIDMRFNYKPHNPLYLLLVRVFAMPEPVTIANTPAYTGCKSWVPLDDPINLRPAVPVLDNPTYQARRTSILETLASVST